MTFWLVRYLQSAGDNFGQLRPAGVYRGSEPGEDTLAKLGVLGIHRIINLEDGDQSAQQRDAEAAHFLWQHIPMSDKAAPQPEQIKAALRALQPSDGSKVFVHCKGGRHRTGLVCAVYRVAKQGWDKQRAWEEAEDEYGFYGALGHAVLEDWFFNSFKVSDYQDVL